MLSDTLLIDRLIVSSPLPRARQTAEIIAGALPGTEIVTDSRILEVDYGQLDGTPIRKGVSFADEAQQKDGGMYRVEPISNIQQRAGEFLADHIDHLDPQSNKLKLAVGHGALWSVIPFLMQSRPLSEVKIQKNYEIVLLTADRVEIVDTRAVDPSPGPSSFETLG